VDEVDEEVHSSEQPKAGGGSMEKKKLLLRIDPALHLSLRKWAEADFRSINAQIEFLLAQAVSKRERKGE
jgi:hypothetical protein